MQYAADNLLPSDGEIYLFENFIAADQALTYHQQLLTNIPWQQQHITLYGRTVQQPRLTAWHTDIDMPYRYSGIEVQPAAWTDALLNIKTLIERKLDHPFNSAFLNLYRNGRDYIGWHRDNEKILGPQPTIASISLGAERVFRLKHRHKQHLTQSLTLTSGSLLLMTGDIQHHWKHCLPKALRVNESRVNITYRQIFPALR